MEVLLFIPLGAVLNHACVSVAGWAQHIVQEAGPDALNITEYALGKLSAARPHFVAL
jgi:hypothetical protein